MLQEQDSGFGIQAGKKPAGYIKLEIKGEKGVLTSFVQGLKYYHDGEYIYKAFIARTHDRPVFVDTGTIVIGNDGKGQKVWRFNASDIEGTGYSIDDFNVFGILVQKKRIPEPGAGMPPCWQHRQAGSRMERCVNQADTRFGSAWGSHRTRNRAKKREEACGF